MIGENDLISLLKAFWANRRIVIIFSIICITIGLFLALFTPKEFSSSTTFLPQEMNSSSNLAGQFGGLAAIAGINFGSANTETIGPEMYPRIVHSTPFMKSILASNLEVDGFDTPMTVRTYYDEVYEPGLPAIVAGYTFGLPFRILKGIRGEQKNEGDERVMRGMIRIDHDEFELIERLIDNISVEVNKVDGHVTIVSRMQTPLLSAQVTKQVVELLQHRIIELKLEKINDQLTFVEQRYQEKMREFKNAQRVLAEFKDRNIRNTTATSLIKESELQSDYDLVFSVVTELEKQLETYRLKAKETMPIFTTVEPVTVPVHKSKPKRLTILIISTFIGLFIGLTIVAIKLFINRFKTVWDADPGL